MVFGRGVFARYGVSGNHRVQLYRRLCVDSLRRLLLVPLSRYLLYATTGVGGATR